jgi:hypothetical protein
VSATTSVTSTSSSPPAPGRFFPPADAMPLVATTLAGPHEAKIIRTSARVVVNDVRKRAVSAIRGDALSAAVFARTDVTRLTPNPLRESLTPTSTAAPAVTARVGNPLR